jgi:hypothetical protein
MSHRGSGALIEKSKVGLFLEDVRECMLLLRRHSSLRYQSDLREYNVRRMVVVDGIVGALEQATGENLPVIHDAIPVESLREVSLGSVQGLMRQTIRNLKRSLHSFEPGSSVAASYRQAILRWEKALHFLSARKAVRQPPERAPRYRSQEGS